MPKYYRSREVVVTAVNTKTQMVTLGSDVATQPDIQAPAGTTKISELTMSVSSSCAATGVGVGLVRIEGDALKSGPEVYTAGGTGGNSAVAIPNNNTPVQLQVNIPIIATNRVQLFGEMTPTDVGQLTIIATLGFD